MIDEYDATLDYLRHHQALIADSSPGYFAIATPLAGVAMGAGSLPESVQLAACVVGLMMSVLWYSMCERLRIYVKDYWTRLEALEEANPGLITKDAALQRSNWFLKNTLSTQRLRTLSYLFGIIAFAAMAAHVLLGS